MIGTSALATGVTYGSRNMMGFEGKYDMVSLILQDHQRVNKLFDAYWNTKDDDDKQRIVYDLIREISVHDGIEDTILYPAAKKNLAYGKDYVDSSLEAHQRVRELAYKLDRMKVRDSGFDNILSSLQKELTSHVKFEEDRMLPELQQVVPYEQLVEYGNQILKAKPYMPTRPHPMAPTQPTLLKAAATLQAPIDKMKDKTREFATDPRRV